MTNAAETPQYNNEAQSLVDWSIGSQTVCPAQTKLIAPAMLLMLIQ
jgi:hypothetical protein